VDHRGRKAYQWQVAAELLYGQVKKIFRRRKLVRVTHVMRLGASVALQAAGPRTGPLWAAQHCFYRAGESDCPRCAWQHWHAAPGPQFSKLRSSSPTWNGGELIIILCVPTHHYEWRSYSPDSARKLWQRGEPTDSGQRAKSWLCCENDQDTLSSTVF